MSVKANANPEDIHITSSNERTIEVNRYIQLATVSDAQVLTQDGKFYLSFTTQTNAANYDVRIKNQTSGEEVKFNINTSPYEITDYLANKGKYLIYIRALPKENSEYLYLASAESGNPCIYDKSEANLTEIENLKFARVDEKFVASWDSVTYKIGEQDIEVDYYYIQLFHTSNKGITKLLFQEPVTSNNLDITKYIAKEGVYKLQAKAVADGWISRGVQTFEDRYEMQTYSDFMRNTVFMNGENYSHYIENFEQLKNLVWHYSLYNDSRLEVDNTVKFVLKPNDIQSQAEAGESETVANTSQTIQTLYQGFKGDDETIAYGDSLTILNEMINSSNSSSLGILKRYTEIGAYQFIDLTSSVKNVNGEDITLYELSFESLLANDKLESLADSNVESYKFFNQKQNPLSTNDRRADNYVFAIDSKAKVDVYTSEQLYMAVQYNKSPNFVLADSVAEEIYNNAKQVLREIVNGEE